MNAKRMTGLAMCAALLAAALGGASPARCEEKTAKPVVQLAILLDTSGSMSGLIEQAKTQLWKVVNEFLSAKQRGMRPELQVALYEYGKSSIPSSERYLRMIVPLTTDLDKVSEELFALRTNGGQEYCGAVIGAATESLKWSTRPSDMKVIFIAGNEAFTQGTVDYRSACRGAIAKGIVVNTIFCGGHASGIGGKWKAGADLADGQYMNIDHNRKVVRINAPQDTEIAKLNAELNKTYVAYGSAGKEGEARQRAQDANAATAAPAVVAERSAAKASANYRNSKWDLVDAVKDGKVDLDKMEDAELPEEMKQMDRAEREEYVKKQSARRDEIRAKISGLHAARRKHVAEKRKELAAEGADTLDQAMTKAIHEQAEKKGLELE